MQSCLQAVCGDITRMRADAVVNAANPTLLGGGGVDGAIHRSAGPALLAACRALPESAPGVRCPTGEARITPGFDLPARYVIHTVGPIWSGGQHGEAGQLALCYRNSLELARQHGLHDILFPAISCGVYGYPAAQAVTIAVRSVDEILRRGGHDWHVRLCCHAPDMFELVRAALAELSSGTT